MPIQIQNHSDGTLAEVTKAHQLKVVAEEHSFAHHYSIGGNSFTALAIDTGITAVTQTLLHIKNISSIKNLIITAITFQAITSTVSKPVVGEYFEIGINRTVSSGGTVITPVNLNVSSGASAPVIATGVDPTMAGTFESLGRIYNKASGDKYLAFTEASLILGTNNTMEIRFTSAGTGETMCIIHFSMIDK